jgi:tRNA pseudouridine32 synthase/23S rRNA pseudouridine746 synthase
MDDPSVILQRDRFVVVDKPAGMLSVPGKGPEKADCAAARVRKMCPGATGPIVVHRLDMDTSGAIVFALDAETQRALSKQFEARTVAKRYEALLAGEIDHETGKIDLPIRADIDNRPMQIHDPVHGRPSVTSYRVLARGNGTTRVEFTPLTGRSHQLRVHAAHVLGLGAPILGDVLYGHEASAPRLMLHATDLSFDDPETGERVTAHTDAPF